jgi:hypothetical protein
MAGLKRFLRHGLFISALGHAGVLAIGLLFVWASPQEAVPPDAMVVEVITPKEMPRLSGTPSELRTSGTEQAAKSQPPIAAKDPPPPVPRPSQQQEQRKAQRNAPPKPQEQQAAPTQPQEPVTPQGEAMQVAMQERPPDPPAETPNASDTAAALAQLALVGGPLGGGFAAPPIDSPVAGYDFTTLFRERVSACSPPVPDVDPSEKISIRVSIFLNRDGTLAAAPQLREPNPSAKQQALMQSFVSGLQKCQPYTMLPQDKFKLWKALDLVIYPLAPYGG